MSLAYAALLCLHLLAATLWVGGMLVMHVAVRPAAVATLQPPLRLSFMAATLERFFAWVSGGIVVLLLSGLAMLGITGGFRTAHWSVHAMFGVGVLMMLIFAHIRFGPFRRLRQAIAAHDWPGAGPQMNRIRQLVVLNLVLGTAVYLVAVLGRAV
jgi:uncharacterized membrane protein